MVRPAGDLLLMVVLLLEAHCFLFFYLDNWAIMLFKTA